jgi:parallel beta-helix repeat protein
MPASGRAIRQVNQMKRVLISIILGLIVFTANGKISASKALKWNLAIAKGTVQQRVAKKITRVANDFPGADLGAKINAADKDLAGAQGEILVRGGGTISTQVIVSPGHTLRFAPGTYTLATELVWEGAILLKSQTTVVGSGWDTVIVEPSRTGWIVFQSFEDIRTKPIHYGTDSKISISNLQIKGANPGVDGSVRQTITLGNCHDCRVENVWFNSTNVIGVQVGGSGLGGNFADNVTIRNNLFTRLAGQAAAVVNGRNIVIDRNTFKDSGRDRRQGMVPIDVEPNDRRDIAQRIEITNNVIDSRGSRFLHGNGILVQNGAQTSGFGPVLIKDNTVIGGELVPNISGNIATGIYVTANTQDVSIINNTVTRVAHCGIRLDGTTRNIVSGNKLISTGTGGLEAFEVIDTTDSQILNNVITIDPASPLGRGEIVETGNSRNNIYRGNSNGRTALTPDIRSRRP